MFEVNCNQSQTGTERNAIIARNTNLITRHVTCVRLYIYVCVSVLHGRAIVEQRVRTLYYIVYDELTT